MPSRDRGNSSKTLLFDRTYFDITVEFSGFSNPYEFLEHEGKVPELKVRCAPTDSGSIGLHFFLYAE
jgi:hypothetical protein